MKGKLERNPDLVWRDEPERREEIVAAMESGAATGDEGWVIVVDGGEIHQLNLVAGDIWMLCDGTREESAIAAELVKAYDTDVAMLVMDVSEFVAECLEKGWLARKD